MTLICARCLLDDAERPQAAITIMSGDALCEDHLAKLAPRRKLDELRIARVEAAP